VGKAQRFERRLQGMVGDAFARVFGGSVVPQEVAQALQREADDNARPLAGGRVLVPNRYTVTLGAGDYDRLAGDEHRVIRMLTGCVRAHVAEQGWDVYGEVAVRLERSETLHTGQFRTSSAVDPDTPHPRSAGDRAMSQQQGEHPWDVQQRQYHHSAEPDYGSPAGRAEPVDPLQGPERRPYGYDQPDYRQYGYDQAGAYQPGYDYSGYGAGGYGGGYGYQQHHPEQAEQPSYGSYAGTSAGYAGYGPESPAGHRTRSATLILDDGSNRQYQLTEGRTIVGRGQDAQFRLPDTGVSRRHLEITWDGHTAILSDLGSTNGTTVNGTPVQTWQLVDGDVVRVGHSRLVFRTQG
jgi:hypothetical protein